jgi:hypothetical protein
VPVTACGARTAFDSSELRSRRWMASTTGWRRQVLALPFLEALVPEFRVDHSFGHGFVGCWCWSAASLACRVALCVVAVQPVSARHQSQRIVGGPAGSIPESVLNPLLFSHLFVSHRLSRSIRRSRASAQRRASNRCVIGILRRPHCGGVRCSTDGETQSLDRRPALWQLFQSSITSRAYARHA